MSKKFVTEENLGAVVDAIVAAFGRVNGKIEGFDAAIKAAQAAGVEAKSVAEGVKGSVEEVKTLATSAKEAAEGAKTVAGEAKSVADAALPVDQLEGKLAEALGEASIDAVKAKLDEVGKAMTPAEGSHEGQPAEGHESPTASTEGHA